MQIPQSPVAPVEIRMEGTFDVEAARALVWKLERAFAELPVRIDLTHVREFHDFAVAILAEAVVRHRGRVSIRGLRQHQLRLLGYLGLGGTAEPEEPFEAAML